MAINPLDTLTQSSEFSRILMTKSDFENSLKPTTDNFSEPILVEDYAVFDGENYRAQKRRLYFVISDFPPLKIVVYYRYLSKWEKFFRSWY